MKVRMLTTVEGKHGDGRTFRYEAGREYDLPAEEAANLCEGGAQRRALPVTVNPAAGAERR